MTILKKIKKIICGDDLELDEYERLRRIIEAERREEWEIEERRLAEKIGLV